jgi:hypothetical protein
MTQKFQKRQQVVANATRTDPELPMSNCNKLFMVYSPIKPQLLHFF